MRALYTIVLYAAMPWVWLRLAWRARRDRGYLRHVGERLGFGPSAGPGGILVHAVSVGEVQAALPLLDLMLEEERRGPILLTTTTPSGRRRGESLFAGRVTQRYLPWDLPGAVRRFLARAAPRAVVVLETELWPNLIHACSERSIPLVYVNARLSERSAAGYRRFRRLFAPTLARVNAVAAQTREDAARLVATGARADRVVVTGNTKLDVGAPAAARESGQHLRGRIGASRRVWIAASTHEGEEEAVLAAFARVREEVEGCRLILVPRHVERAGRIAALVRRRGYSVSLRTGGFDEAADVLLGDTMGELPAFYAASDLAFVGGSLVDVGGHNLLEPALLGVPALTGPHTRNFADLAASLQAIGAVRTVHGAEDLARTVVDLLRDPNRRYRMGEEGRRFVLSNRGARERTMAVIDRLLEASP